MLGQGGADVRVYADVRVRADGERDAGVDEARNELRVAEDRDAVIDALAPEHVECGRDRRRWRVLALMGGAVQAGTAAIS